MPNIDEIEKDVEIFHNNIKNSNDLINKINKQTETLDARMLGLNETIDNATDNLVKSNEKITSDFASLANKTVNDYKAISEGVIESTKSSQSQYISQLDQMYKSIDESTRNSHNQYIGQLDQMYRSINETTRNTQGQYLGQLDQMYKMEYQRQQQIEASQQKVANMLNANASLFEGFPDNVVSEFNKKLLDYEKRMNIKMAIGFASTIILAVVSFFF